MKYVQETYARELHGLLSQESTAKAQIKSVSINGAGVHWDVTAENGSRLCKIHCFDTRGPEYLIDFQHDKQGLAMGRTSSTETALAAAASWVQGDELSAMHSQFEFVDKQKRSLERISKEVIAHRPELQQETRAALRHQVCDLYELWFRAGDRSCRISYYGKNTVPDEIFHWDECQIFKIQTGDFKQLATILSRWLCAHVQPSILKNEYPWIELGVVARYYEEGRGIEGEFIESWDRIERFFSRMNFPPADDIRAFVTQLRPRYETSLRAGQSMYSFILSRSRRHGLRQGQPHLKFQFRRDGMDLYAEVDGAHKTSFPRIELNEEITRKLDTLVAQPID